MPVVAEPNLKEIQKQMAQAKSARESEMMENGTPPQGATPAAVRKQALSSSGTGVAAESANPPASKPIHTGTRARTETMPHQNQVIDQSNTLLEWESPEFAERPKNRQWFITGAVALIALLAFAILTQSYLFAVTLGITAAVVYYFAVKKPERLQIKITQKGVHFHDQFHPYSDLESFWIIYMPGENTTLNFNSKRFISWPITIQLAEQDPNEVRDVLADHVREDFEREESVPERLARKMKF